MYDADFPTSDMMHKLKRKTKLTYIPENLQKKEVEHKRLLQYSAFLKNRFSKSTFIEIM